MDEPFPPGFFDRADPSDDARFYGPPRLVTHIDDGAIRAVGDLYAELGIEGRVLDLMSSWVSHFHTAPADLVVLGMNAEELRRNPQAAETVVRDLNRDPSLPFEDASVDHAVCCVSIDYLVRPLEVLAETARVLRPGGLVVLTFSNRCFPTKAIRGWLATDDAGRVAIVERYLELTPSFEDVRAERRPSPGDPLYAVVSTRARTGGPTSAPRPAG